MSQSWIEITLEVDKAEAEDWADALLEAGALLVQAEDADADSPDEQPRAEIGRASCRERV